MLHQNGRVLVQNHIEVRLVQRNSYFDEPVGGFDLQLLILLVPIAGLFSIPNIAPPARRTTSPNLSSASAKLVMS
jgi:hypothetical protein